MDSHDSLPLSQLYESLKLLNDDQVAIANNHKVKLYYDTQSAVAALQGVNEYFSMEGNKPHLKKGSRGEALFEEPQALVSCLLASSWLGQFRLLPPHGAEFARLLDDGRLFPLEPRDRLVDEFLSAIGIQDNDANKRRSIIELSAEGMYELVRTQAAKAERGFKAVQCILFTPQERLVQWHKNDLLRSSDHTFDYPRLTRSSGFSKLLKTFDAHRGSGKAANNFADSIVLVMLRELCRRASEGALLEIPRFFDHTGFLTRMAKEAGIEESLFTLLPNGSRTPVLVDANYLIYKATFLPSPYDSNTTSPLNPSEVFSRLHQIVGREGVGAGTLNNSEVLELSALAQLTIGQVPLLKVLHDISSYAFLKNIWLAEVARRELAGLAERFDKAIVQSKEFREELDETIRRVKLDFEEQAASYVEIYTLWHELKKSLARVRRQHRERLEKQVYDFDPIRDLELVRFSLSPKATEDVSLILRKLLDLDVADDDLIRLRRWADLVRRFYAVKNSQHSEFESAQVVAAILWVLKRDSSIVEILDPLVGQTDEVAIDILYAAACFRGAPGQGEEVLTKLNAKLVAAEVAGTHLVTDREQLASLAIGVAYLSKHLWDKRGYGVTWMNSRNSSNRPADREGHELLRRAVDSSTKAARILGEIELELDELDRALRMRKLYALNQRLFYYTQLGPTDTQDLEKMRTAFTDLTDQKPRWPDLWQPTFDDTLARYHHFRSTQTSDLSEKVRQLSKALEYSDRAHKAAPYDDLIYEYNGTLVDELGEAREQLKRGKAL